MNEKELQKAYTNHCESLGRTKLTAIGWEDFQAGFKLALATQPAVPIAYINYDSNGKPYLSWAPSNHPHRVLIEAKPAVRGAEYE